MNDGNTPWVYIFKDGTKFTYEFINFSEKTDEKSKKCFDFRPTTTLEQELMSQRETDLLEFGEQIVVFMKKYGADAETIREQFLS